MMKAQHGDGQNVVSYCRTVCREMGARELIARILRRASFGLISTRHAIWYVKNLSSQSGREGIEAAMPVHVDFHSFPETVRWMEELPESWVLTEAERTVAEQEGHYWANVKTGQEIIGYLKVGMNRVYINDFEKVVTFPSGTAFISDTFVLPEYRNRKIAACLVDQACQFLREKGFVKVLCHIPVWNKASSAVYTKLGFVPTKAIRYVRLFGFSFLTSNPAKL